jgi:threonine dehydrogenase-like Zn-dependent dehydrogenase
MKAITWHGKRDVRVDSVPDPSIEESTEAIVRITSTRICGSDLHLHEGARSLHKLPLDEGPRGYEVFQKKEDGAIKVVLKP